MKQSIIAIMTVASILGMLLVGCGTNGSSSQTEIRNGPNQPTKTPQNQTIQSQKKQSKTDQNAPSWITAIDQQHTTLKILSGIDAQNIPSSNATQTRVTLENIQITDSSVIITTTHGDMQSTYDNPKIINGNPKQFIVTLKNIDPGKYALNQSTSIHSNWGTSMHISQANGDMHLIFRLKSYVTSFKPSIGGGDIIQFTFQSKRLS